MLHTLVDKETPGQWSGIKTLLLAILSSDNIVYAKPLV